MKNEHQHITLHLSGLADGEYRFTYDLPEGSLELPDSFREKIHVVVELDKLRSQYVIKGGVATTSVHPCDRCLEPVHLALDRKFTIVCSYDAVDSDEQLERDEMRTLDPSDPKIDLTGDVREALVLGIPMRITCGDDAHGNPVCTNPFLQDYQKGANDIDPRWEALKSKILTTD